jgi:hypothetical protein
MKRILDFRTSKIVIALQVIVHKIISKVAQFKLELVVIPNELIS